MQLPSTGLEEVEKQENLQTGEEYVAAVKGSGCESVWMPVDSFDRFEDAQIIQMSMSRCFLYWEDLNTFQSTFTCVRFRPRL